MSNRFHNKFHRHNHHTRPTDRDGIYPDSAYDPIASPEAPFRGEFYVDGNITTLSSVSAGGDLFATNGTFHQNLTVKGDLDVLGNMTYLDTLVHTTSAMTISNVGTGPALTVTQAGYEPIAHFIDSNGEDIVFADDGKVGLGTYEPNERLTVIGKVTATEGFYDLDGNSNEWNSVYSSVSETSANWDSVYSTVVQTSSLFLSGLTLTTNFVPKYSTEQQLINTKISENEQTVLIDNRLRVTGETTLTNRLTGTVGIFTNSISAVRLFGNGNGLTDVRDLTKLHLSGGTLTGGLTGTTGLFTTSLSAPLLFGDGSNIGNVAKAFTSNTFNQPQIVAVNSPLPALRVTQLGTGEVIRVEDEATDTTAFVVDSSGNTSIKAAIDTGSALNVGGNIRTLGNITIPNGNITFADSSVQTSAGVERTGGIMTGHLSGTVGMFTQHVSAGRFFGDGSGLTGFPPVQASLARVLPLSGGMMTGPLTGQRGSFASLGIGNPVNNFSRGLTVIGDENWAGDVYLNTIQSSTYTGPNGSALIFGIQKNQAAGRYARNGDFLGVMIGRGFSTVPDIDLPADEQGNVTGAGVYMSARGDYNNKQTVHGDVGIWTTFAGNHSEVLRVTHNACVGIGTTTPNAKLAVVTNENSQPAVFIRQTGAGEALRVEDDTVTPDPTPFIVSGDGSVSVRSQINPNAALTVGGSTITSNITADYAMFTSYVSAARYIGDLMPASGGIMTGPFAVNSNAAGSLISSQRTSSNNVNPNVILNNFDQNFAAIELFGPGGGYIDIRQTGGLLAGVNCETDDDFGLRIRSFHNLNQIISRTRDLYLGVGASGDATQFVLKANARVGIGTNTPSEKLEVIGRIRAQEVIATNADGIKLFQPNYGAFFRNDGSNFYLLQTPLNYAPGIGNSLWNENRPLSFNFTTGSVSLAHGTSPQCIIGSIGTIDSRAEKLVVNGGIYATEWIRTKGTSGFIFETYGGGWHMTDNTWIRAYGNKPVWVENIIGSNGGLTVGYNGQSPLPAGASIRGWVGIGLGTPSAITVPSQALDVNGNVRITGTLWTNNNSTLPPNWGGGVAARDVYVNDGTFGIGVNGSLDAIITKTGYAKFTDLEVTNPAGNGRIEIAGTTGAYIDLKAPNSGIDYNFRMAHLGGENNFFEAFGSISFWTAPVGVSRDALVHRMQIRQSGGIAIFGSGGVIGVGGNNPVSGNYLEIISSTNSVGISNAAAYIALHRPGLWAAKIGIDTDNELKIGGWSYQNNAYKILHEGLTSFVGNTTFTAVRYQATDSVGLVVSNNDFAQIVLQDGQNSTNRWGMWVNNDPTKPGKPLIIGTQNTQGDGGGGGVITITRETNNTATIGNVGIGEYNPTESLTVVGNISASGTIYADTFVAKEASPILECGYIKRLGKCAGGRNATITGTTYKPGYAAITTDERVIAWGNLHVGIFGLASDTMATENVRVPFWTNYGGYEDGTAYKPYGGDFLDQAIKDGESYTISELYWSRNGAMALLSSVNEEGGDVWVAGTNTKGALPSPANPKALVKTKFNNFLIANETSAAADAQTGGLHTFTPYKDVYAIQKYTTGTQRDIIEDRTNSSDIKADSFYYISAGTVINKVNHYGELVASYTYTVSPNAFVAPNGLAMALNDSGQNLLYVCDNTKIKVFNVTNNQFNFVTAIGTGTQGVTDGTGTSATFHTLKKIAVDPSNPRILYVTDSQRIRRIWKTNSGSYIVSTISNTTNTGGDVLGNLTLLTSPVKFSNPYGIKVSPDGKKLYIVDQVNKKIKIAAISLNTENSFSAVVTNYVDATIQKSASFNDIGGITKDSQGNLYVADWGNNKIRKVEYNSGTGQYGSVTTYAGTGAAGTSGGNRLSATFYGPWGITYCPTNNSLYVVTYYGCKISRIDLGSGIVTIVAGAAEGFRDGAGTTALFNNPIGITYGQRSGKDYLWVTDYDNYCIRQIEITGTTHTVTTVVGNRSAGATLPANGSSPTQSKIGKPYGIYYHAGSDSLYFTHLNSIQKLNFSDNKLYTVIGKGVAGTATGNANIATFSNPGFMIAKGADLYICERNNFKIKQITNFTSDDPIQKVSSVFAGSSNGYRNGIADTSQFIDVEGIILAPNNNDFILSDKNLIRKIYNTNGVNYTTTIDGTLAAGKADTIITSINWDPYGIEVDSDGIVYFSEVLTDTIGTVAADPTTGATKVEIYPRKTAGHLGIGDGSNKSTCGFIKVKAIDLVTGAVPKFKRIQFVGEDPTALLFAALDTEDSLWVWGNSVDGAFGTGQKLSIGPTKLYAFDNNVSDFQITCSTSGRSLISIITKDGKMFSAGDNTVSQLGRGETATTNPSYSIFRQCKKASNTFVTDAYKIIEARETGYKNNLYINKDGDVFACGDHQTGVLGREGVTAVSPYFTQVSNLNNVRYLTGTSNYRYDGNNIYVNHTIFAIKNDDTIWSWGYNGATLGQCLANDVTRSIITTPVQCYNFEGQDVVRDAKYIFVNDGVPVAGQSAVGYLDNNNDLYLGGYSTEADIPDFAVNIPYFRKFNMKNIGPDVNLVGEQTIVRLKTGVVYTVNRYGAKKLF